MTRAAIGTHEYDVNKRIGNSLTGYGYIYRIYIVDEYIYMYISFHGYFFICHPPPSTLDDEKFNRFTVNRSFFTCFL